MISSRIIEKQLHRPIQEVEDSVDEIVDNYTLDSPVFIQIIDYDDNRVRLIELEEA